MIQETITYECTRCGSLDLAKNGRTKKGKQKFRCNECGAYGTLNPEVAYTEEEKAEILRAYHERSSLSGLERTFGVCRQTVSKWLKKSESATIIQEYNLTLQYLRQFAPRPDFCAEGAKIGAIKGVFGSLRGPKTP